MRSRHQLLERFDHGRNARGRDDDAIARAADQNLRTRIDALDRKDFEPGRCLPAELVMSDFRIDGDVELQLDDFFTTHDSQAKGEGEYQSGLRIESLCAMDRQTRATQHALEAPHQVMMADQAQVVALAESDSQLVTGHARESGRSRIYGAPGTHGTAALDQRGRRV